MSKKVTIKSRSSAEKAPLPSVKFGEAEKKPSKLKKPSTEIEIRKSSLKATTSAVKTPESNSQTNNEIVNLKPVEPTVTERSVKEIDKPKDSAETINLKIAVSIVFHRANQILNEKDRWPAFLDANDLFSGFCRVRETRYLNCMNSDELVADIVREKILTAYYYGHPLIIDFGSDDYTIEKFINVCNEIDTHLYGDICNKTFIKNKKRYKDLIKKSDLNQFKEDLIGEYEKFYVAFLSNNLKLEEYFSKFAIPFIVKNE
jgi:hypothetical protein